MASNPDTTVGLDDAEALATWCVFWSEMPGGPRQGAMAAKVLRMQATEIARLRRGWLRAIQQENSCPATGGGCLAKRCSCVVEMEILANEQS